jgi:hypothetical protein
MTAMLLLLSMVLVKLQHQYKHFLSDFKIWNQKTTCKRMVGFPENIGKRLSDRNGSFQWELYTILTNKAAKGKKGTIVAMIAGTKAQTVIAIIKKYHLNYEIQFLR